MNSVLQEIHDRSMWQVAGLYAGFSWLVLQVVQTFTEGLGLPEWVMPFAFILLMIGLPIVLVTAFVQRGLKRRVAPGPAEEGDGSEGAAAIATSGAAHVMTWRRASLGGVGAALVFTLVAGAWALMRSMGIGPAGTLVARGVLDERDVILLADFENATDDPGLSGVITEALRVDLSQSGAVRLADGGFVSGALARMELSSDTPVTGALAREIGQREGLKALVTGEIARAGIGYSLTARVERPDTGEILVSHRESARDSTRLLNAIDDLSKRIRERIGDPLRSLAATPPLAQVTTSNLEALRKFTESVRLPDADIQRSIQLLEEAVALDSTFASAWRSLGILLQNYGAQPGRAMDATRRAFELRDRLTRSEREAIEVMYYLNVTYEPRRAIPVFEATIAREPDNHVPLVNIGEAYRNLGDLETALGWYRRALEIDSTQSIALMNVAQVSTTLGDFDTAESTSDLLDRYGHLPYGNWHRAIAAWGRLDYDTAEPLMRRVRDAVVGSPFLLATTTGALGRIAGTRGRLADQRRLLREAAEVQAEAGVAVEALRVSIESAMSSSLASGSPRRTDLDAALASYPLEAMDPVERPYLELADAYALLGFASEARDLLAEFDRTAPEDFARGLRFRRQMTVGDIALAEGRFDDAIQALRQSASRPQEIEPAARLARAFDAAGRPDSARAYYARYVESSHWLRLQSDPEFLAPSLERLADLEAEAGDLEAAARRYATFVELWADADPELQPRVARAQRRLQEIYDRIG